MDHQIKESFPRIRVRRLPIPTSHPPGGGAHCLDASRRTRSRTADLPPADCARNGVLGKGCSRERRRGSCDGCDIERGSTISARGARGCLVSDAGHDHLSDDREGSGPAGILAPMSEAARRRCHRSPNSAADVQQTGPLEADVGSSRSLADGCDLAGGQFQSAVHNRWERLLPCHRRRSSVPSDTEARGEEGVSLRLPLPSPRTDPGCDRSERRGGRLGARDGGGGCRRRVLHCERASRSSGMVLLERGCAPVVPRRGRRRSDDAGSCRRLEAGLRG
jgi:hypothetical protein